VVQTTGAGHKAGIASAHTSNEGWSTFEINLSNIIELASTGNGSATAIDIIDARFGTDTASGTSGTNDDLGIVPDPLTDNIDNDGDWVTGNDTNGNGIPDSGETDVDEADEATDEPNEFNSIFPYGDDVPLGLLSEAEIMGTSSYESRLEEIFTTRGVSQADQETLKGWLTTYSADTILCPPYTLDGGTSTTRLNINALANNEGAYTNTTTYDSNKKAQMLVDVLTAGGVPDVERQQLAVNIIDFADSNGTVTAYNDGSNTYYGVEMTPYINEVEAKTNDGDDEFIELFNPYDTAIPNTGDWTITLDGDTTTIILSGLTVPADDYYVIADLAGADVDQVDAAGINNLDDGGEELILRDSSGNVVQVTSYGGADAPKTCSLNDPRPTPLMDADGTANIDASTPWRWDTDTNNTIGAENQNFDPGKGSDGWDGGTWTPSFVTPDRYFTNKGNLGFIHNGRQWTSFRVGDTGGYPIAFPNVLQYITVIDPSMDNIDNDGDGDIDGQEYRIPGLINVNTASVEVLQSLPNIDSTIATAIQGSGSKPFTSIGNMVDNVAEITDTSATNKWGEEKIFRSISNLITTRSNVFTVYVTAQVTEEDVSDPPNTNVFAEKRILAIVDRSVNPIRVRYFRWIVE